MHAMDGIPEKAVSAQSVGLNKVVPAQGSDVHSDSLINVVTKQPVSHSVGAAAADVSGFNNAVTKQPVSSAAVYANSPVVPGDVSTNAADYVADVRLFSPFDQLFIKQKVELLEALTGCETSNKYEILNNMGQKMFTAEESSCCCTRQCCGKLRPFTMEISDLYGTKFMFVDRSLRCTSCLFPCCLQRMTVESPKGVTIGYIRQNWSLCWPSFNILTEIEDPLFLITGPLCQCKVCGSVNFQIKSPDGTTKVGNISKEWSGLVKEIFTDADNFGVQFPVGLSPKHKAVILAAVFLIDFMFFEENEKKPDLPGMIDT